MNGGALAAPRHYCRQDRTKLAEPTDNLRRAFCTRFCWEQFYRHRCVVCEKPIRRKNERQKTCIDHDCKAAIRRYPLAYSWPEKQKTGDTPSAHKCPSETLDSSCSKPRDSCLRGWAWSGDGHGDYSLYDKDGLTLARIELDGSAYRLRSPVTSPCLSWPGLEQAKRGAESIALADLPLVAGVNIEPRELARINATNGKSHAMGPPINRSPSAAGNFRITESKVPGDPGELPECLRRAAS